ncbi:MAG: hypothetical protein R2823_07065 [Acidimicrobiia bacterium]
MRERDESVLHEILPPEERAIEAVVARYQRVAPAVTRFARSLAGSEDLQVRLGTQAASTMDTIIIDPRAFQTAYARSAPVTPAEVALTSALHEVIHLIATDLDEQRPIPKEWLPFARTSDTVDEDEGPMVPVGLFQLGEMEDDVIRPDIDDSDIAEDDEPDAASMTVLEGLHTIGGPAAEALFFAIEDARQERIHFEAYPGAGSVLKDLYGTSVGHAMGKARPLGQFALACFMIVGGHEERDRIQRRLDPHVAVAIDDAVAFLDPVLNVDDVWSVGTIALQLLSVARMHNLVQEGAATTAQHKAQEQADGAAIADTVDAVRMVTPPLADRESYDQTRQAAQSVSAHAGAKGDADQAGDPATDQLMRVSTAPTVFLPTGQGGKLLVTDLPTLFTTFAPQGRTMLERAGDDWGVAQHRVSGELYPLFLANQRRGLRSGFDAGDLSPYTPLLLGAGLYERMFERRDLPSRRSYAVSLLVDGSASMLQPRDAGGRKTPWAMAAALLGAWTLARLADELQIDFEVAIFNRSFAAGPDDSELSYRDTRTRATAGLRQAQGGNAERLTRTVNHYLVKSFRQRWRSREDILAGLFYTAASPQDAARDARKDPASAPPVSMFDKAANVDEFNVSHAAERLVAQHAAHRILVVLADGMTRGSAQALAETVAEVEYGGATVLGIGIGDDTVRAAYSRAQVVEQPRHLAAAVVEGVRSALYRSIAASGVDAWWGHEGERVLKEQMTGATNA